MFAAFLALLQAIPVIGRVVDKLLPSREERRETLIRKEKQRERDKIDEWIDRGGPPAGLP
jgi:hypothetical protein